jgi:hypothetical protein
MSDRAEWINDRMRQTGCTWNAGKKAWDERPTAPKAELREWTTTDFDPHYVAGHTADGRNWVMWIVRAKDGKEVARVCGANPDECRSLAGQIIKACAEGRT